MKTSARIRMVPVDQLHVSKLNPRRGPGDVSELAASIRQVGILQPLLVTPNGDGYIVLGGQRRLIAARKAKLREVPCFVRRMGEREREIAMLVENVQRVALSPIEEATVYVRLMKLHGLNQREVAEATGVSDFKVSTYLALLRLPKDIVESVDRGETTISEALRIGGHRDARAKPLAKPRGLPVSLHTLKAHERCNPKTCEIRARRARSA